MSKNPQRILKGRYQVVPRTIVLLIKDAQVLLQKAPNNKKIFPGFMNGIGGHLERGEDVKTGAIRELREEAGIECKDLALAGTIMIDVEDEQGILLFVFSGQEVYGKLMESDEGTLHWVKIKDLSSLKVVEDISELVLKIIDFRNNGKLFFGTYLYDEEGKRITHWIE
jgi:8-oxo-dGTP diphosphatase